MEPSKAFKIYGLDCAEEVAILKRELGPRFGFNNLSFDILNAKMIVSDGKVSPAEIISSVEKTGMRAETWESFVESSAKTNNSFEKWGRSLLTLVSGFLLALGFSVDVFQRGLGNALTEQAQYPMHWAVRAIYR